MATVSPGWSTSFIYKQDLTSYYMNSLLRSLIRPGIYNANMALKNDSDNFSLLIKKGTTFVFSNDYVNTTLGIRRNFNHFDYTQSSYDSSKESPCIIKCVALSDISIQLGVFEGSSMMSLHAFIKYNPKDSGVAETNSPTFLWVKEGTSESSYLYKIQGGAEIGSIGIRYQSDANSNKTLSFNPPIILDGSSDILEDYLQYYYLNVGFVKTDANGIVSFTGRGLPEYRYSSFIDTDTLYPDIVPNMLNDLSSLYVDVPEALIGTLIVDNPMPAENSSKYHNWEAAYISSRVADSASSEKIAFESTDTGVFAIYGLVSNIKSFDDTPNEVTESTLKFDKLLIPELELEHTNDFNNYWFSASSSFVALDTSILNIKDIATNLIGKDIWSYVIEHVRSDENSDPEKITDIIPLGLVTVSDGKIVSEKTINYLNLQERLSRINVINVREHNIFNVIPVMD